MISRRRLLLVAFSPAHHKMMRLPGGTFRMGSDKDVLLRQFSNAGEGLKSMPLSETPAHDVTIPPFWMDRHEVTNGDFQRLIRARYVWRKEHVGGDYLRNWDGDQFPEGQANFPVALVTWRAAVAYAEWAGKRLPTESEWEFAGRGGFENPKYPWGNREPTPKDANYRSSANHSPVRVGTYPPNPYGLFDLAGNVWDSCLDDRSAPYPSGPQRQSEGDLRRKRAAVAERRVIRGGGFDGTAFNMRVTSRHSHLADCGGPRR